MPMKKFRKRHKTMTVITSAGKHKRTFRMPFNNENMYHDIDNDGDEEDNANNGNDYEYEGDANMYSDRTEQSRPIDDLMNTREFDDDSDDTESRQDNNNQEKIKESSSKYSYYKSQRIETWKKLQPKLYSAFISGECLASHTCALCGDEGGKRYRCTDCVHWEVLCVHCLELRHDYPHLHIFEEWKNNAFIRVGMETPIWKLRHQCETSYTKDLVVVDDKGRQHDRKLEFCQCETESERLVKFKLWPSTTKQPKLAFHFDLLDWLNGLNLEGHLSLKAFCGALKARASKHSQCFVDMKVQDIYKALVTETYEEYRFFSNSREHPFDDDGTECPCCYLSQIKAYSLDADFQLVRKRSAGNCWDDPKHADKYFFDQKEVDQFMIEYRGDTVKADVDCSDFQAGSVIRAKNKNQKLSETALFGSTCRHEYPKYFFSLKHGERLGYAVFLIKKLLQENTDPKKIFILYDIACNLKSHLMKQGQEEILNKITLAIPIFHSYGHKVPCQIMYGPRRIEGLGLTDGEACERLWSYLGKFANITKESTPEHRVDQLTEGLLYYSFKLREKIGTTLTLKLIKCKALESSTLLAFNETLKLLPDMSEENVIEWVELEKEQCNNSPYAIKLDLTPQEEYSQALNLINDVKEDENKYKIIKRTINKCEKRLGVQWNITDKPCITNYKSAQIKKKKNMLNTLHSLVSERAYLLDLIKKYARGQAIAGRISKQAKSVNLKIKQQLKVYNSLSTTDKLKFEDLNLESDVWSLTILERAGVSTTCTISPSIKNQLVNLKCLLSRCSEEVTLIHQEMDSAISFYQMRHQHLYNSFVSSPGGLSALAAKEGLYVEIKLCDLYKKF